MDSFVATACGWNPYEELTTEKNPYVLSMYTAKLMSPSISVVSLKLVSMPSGHSSVA